MQKGPVRVRDSISLPEDEKKKVINKVNKKKSYGLWDFFKFTVPYLWRGGFWIRL
jgi:hypothetical protein